MDAPNSAGKGTRVFTVRIAVYNNITEFWWIASTVGELKVCKEPSCSAIPPVQQGILNIGIKLLLGHSMSNQHKKTLSPPI